MPRKRQSPRSGPYRAPRVNALAFRDTIVSEFEPAQGAVPIETFTIDQLLPSLKARTVILENFVVEVLPAINPANVTETTGQVRFRTPGTGYVLADAPFKMVSAVNPTQLGFNVQKMARQAPNICSHSIPMAPTLFSKLICLVLNRQTRPESGSQLM